MEQFFFFVSLAAFLFAGSLYGRHLGGSVYESLFLAVAALFVWLVYTSLLLVRAGHHYLWLVSAAMLLAALVMHRCSRTRPTGGRADAAEWERYLLPALALAVATFHALYPTYYLLGGRDPGLYLIYAVVIGKTGALDLATSSALLAEYGVQGFGTPSYPGLYDPIHRGFDGNPALYIPQFHHAFSALSAVFYEVAGLEGVVRTNAFIGFFALWSFGEMLRRFVGTRFAILGLLFLGLNVAFVWNARITLTETMSLTAVFAGLVYLVDALRHPDRAWPAVLAGLLLSISALTRIDGVLVSGLLLAIAFGYERNEESVRRVLLTTGAVYFALSGFALLDAWLHSRAYYQDLWHHGSAKGLVLGHMAMMFGYFGLIWTRGRSEWEILDQQLDRPWKVLAQTAALFIAALFAFLYFIYPDWAPTDFGHRAFREMGWYASPVLFVGLPLGLWLAARSAPSRLPVLFAVFFAAAVVLFSLKPAITPDHIWASRRWLPLVLPGLIFSTCLCLSLIIKPFRIWVVTVAIAVYFATTYPYAKHFYFRSILSDYPAQYEKVAGELNTLREQADLPFLASEGWIASVLRYVYDLPVVLIHPKYAREVLNFGSPIPEGVYFLGRSDLGARFESLVESSVCGEYLEKKRAERPNGRYERCYEMYAYKIEYADASPRTVMPVSPEIFFTTTGEWSDTGVASTGVAGWLLFGPYSRLAPGMYRVTWGGTFDCAAAEHELLFQVATDHGKKIVVSSDDANSAGTCRTEAGRTAFSLSFNTENRLSNVEYRVFSQAGVESVIETVMVERVEEIGE